MNEYTTDIDNFVKNSLDPIAQVKHNNDMYLAGEPEFFPVCEICQKQINGDPVKTETMIGFGEDDLQADISLFCSDKCKYIGLLISPMHQMMGDINKIVNHLIREHGCNVDILESALNSDYYKKLKE